MKTNNKEYSLKDLESMFANDFSTPTSPLLAELYFQSSQFDRAKKVCQIGIRYNPGNDIAQYVLSKIYLIENNHKEAEKLLKNIIDNNQSNFQALLLYISVVNMLNRNVNAQANYIKRAYSIDPKNKKIKFLYNQLNIKKTGNNGTKAKDIIKTKNPILFNERLATKTMYAVLKKQKKYNEALELLQIMKKNKKNQSFVNDEYKKVLKLIK